MASLDIEAVSDSQYSIDLVERDIANPDPKVLLNMVTVTVT